MHMEGIGREKKKKKKADAKRRRSESVSIHRCVGSCIAKMGKHKVIRSQGGKGSVSRNSIQRRDWACY